MNEKYRFFTTFTIWMAFAAVLITLFVSLAATGANMDEMAMIMIASFVITLTVVAGISTGLVWRGAGAGSAESVEAQKGKREVSNRIERLVEQLDADEVVELETLLMARQDQQDL